MSHLKEGMKAPLFEGIDQNRNEVKLTDYIGRKVILFFYPKDDTPGCTVEACNLRDNYNDLLEKSFSVIGISADNVKSHKSFSKKFSLPFPLIADESRTIIDKYDVWGEKTLFGNTFMGIIRTTFVIDEKGTIEKIIRKVDTEDHTEQILKMYNK